MPSYTFASTANAIALRGAIPVFVDIRPDTFNLDESKVTSAITSKTKAIVPIHYAGVGCEMDAILKVAHEHNLLVIEDAAQGIMASYKGRPLGSMGNLSALSFHQTKNLSSGEGGALVINEECWIESAEIIAEKGTNRHRFSQGMVDHYTWTSLGSSYFPSDLVAAMLLAQLEHAECITQHRLRIWTAFHQGLEGLEASGRLQRPQPPEHCQHNGHIYAILLADRGHREDLRRWCLDHNVNATTHYVPLHSSPAGRAFCRVADQLPCTESTADRLLRLPMNFPHGNIEAIENVIAVIQAFFAQGSTPSR